jgi:hypothetical protein
VTGGQQVINRHGEEVAVVVDIAECRRLTRPAVDLRALLLGGPKLDDQAARALTEVEAGRKVWARPGVARTETAEMMAVCSMKNGIRAA